MKIIKKNYFLLFFFLFSLRIMSQEYDLTKFPQGAAPEEVGLKLIEKYLHTPHSQYGNVRSGRLPKIVTYPDVCTWLGALWFADVTRNECLFSRLEDRFQPILTDRKSMQPSPDHVDNNVFGAVPLELYKKNPRKDYSDLGLMYANTQWDVPEEAKPEEKDWAEKGFSWQTRIWIDDMFMITAIQAQAFGVTGDEKYIDRAAREMGMYLEKIQRPNGLFYHSPETPFFWGRGNGWMAVGMTEMLRLLPENNAYRPIIMEGYKKMMATLLQSQNEDGMWNQLVGDKNSYKETSGTAMFTYAMITGVKSGWLDSQVYGVASRKAWLAMVKYINDDNDVTEVCIGTNIKNDYQYYLDRERIVGDLHGQAPYIWCTVALLR